MRGRLALQPGALIVEAVLFVRGRHANGIIRHLAALDFLLHIPLKNEAKLCGVNGIHSGIPLAEPDDRSISAEREETAGSVDFAVAKEVMLLVQQEDQLSRAPGRKLDGKAAPTGRFSPELRYKQSKLLEHAAVMRQWEDSLLRGAGEYRQQLLPSRIFYSRARGYPLCVMSVLHYAPEAEQAKMDKEMNVDTQGLSAFNQPVRDWRGNSFMSVFQDSSVLSNEDYLFDPDSLDDPELAQGKHRYVLLGSEKTGPIKSSVILYVNDEDLQENLNDQFRESHSQLPHGLTLTKIRNIKKGALAACLNAKIEITTVAIACIAFEKLCLMGIVTKSNRRLSMASVLLLAAKLSEETICSDGPKKIESILEFADREWSISRREIFAAEFGKCITEVLIFF